MVIWRCDGVILLSRSPAAHRRVTQAAHSPPDFATPVATDADAHRGTDPAVAGQASSLGRVLNAAIDRGKKRKAGDMGKQFWWYGWAILMIWVSSLDDVGM